MLLRHASKALAGGWQFAPAMTATAAMGREPLVEKSLNSALFTHFSCCHGDGNENGELQRKPLICSDYYFAAPHSIDTPLCELGLFYWMRSSIQGARQNGRHERMERNPSLRRTSAARREHVQHMAPRSRQSPTRALRANLHSMSQLGPAQQEQSASVLRSPCRESGHA